MRNKQYILSVVVCLLPIVLGIVLWNRLPAQIAIHFDAAGNPDNYAPKALAVFGLPVFFAAINAFGIFSMTKDPKAERQSKTMRKMACWLCPVLCNIIMPITLFIALGEDIPIGMIVIALVGVIITVIGNYLPKCKRNYTIGIKLPWTLNDEDNWNHTHRFSGFVWTAVGILLVINAFVQISYLNITLFAILIFLPFIYSYVYYRKQQQENC